MKWLLQLQFKEKKSSHRGKIVMQLIVGSDDVIATRQHQSDEELPKAPMGGGEMFFSGI